VIRNRNVDNDGRVVTVPPVWKFKDFASGRVANSDSRRALLPPVDPDAAAIDRLKAFCDRRSPVLARGPVVASEARHANVALETTFILTGMPSLFTSRSPCAIVAWMDQAPTRKVIHVDMDAFFASVEQRDDPALRGRPVAVGYPAARGVVAAASYEARQFGVRSALPSVTALRRCPELVFVKPRFDVYRTVSRQIHAIFEDYTPLIQPLSLDEAYLDVTENLRGLPTAWATAKEIRARILAETGLTASAGISYNKFLAKLASGHRKPNGQFAVTPGMGEAWVESLSVARFHGVGPVTARKMQALGIETGANLKAKPLVFLQTHFGSGAAWYYAIARGQDDRPVDPGRTRKSSGSETTFDRDLTKAAEIEAGVLRMADDVWSWCETRKASAGP
jgi:DNA polymerase-4